MVCGDADIPKELGRRETNDGTPVGDLDLLVQTLDDLPYHSSLLGGR